MGQHLINIYTAAPAQTIAAICLFAVVWSYLIIKITAWFCGTMYKRANKEIHNQYAKALRKKTDEIELLKRMRT